MILNFRKQNLISNISFLVEFIFLLFQMEGTVASEEIKNKQMYR
jgi:hypothetical protein